MQPLKFKFVFFLSSLSIFMLVYSSAGDAAKFEDKEILSHRFKYYDMDFADSKNVWIVGYPGVIQHSANGGESWQFIDLNLDEALFSVSFVDNDHGWIAGRSGLMLHTVDGGKNFRKQSKLE